MFAFTLLLAATLQADDQLLPIPQIADDVNTCVLCHGTPEFWAADQQQLFVPPEKLAADVHYQRGVKCHECHGGNPQSLDAELAHLGLESSSPGQAYGNMTKTCGSCHEDQQQGMREGVHRGVFVEDSGAETSVSCRTCHNETAHNMLPVSDPESPVYLRNQVAICADCHEEAFEEYRRSGHGKGLFQSGLASATCADCHGAHGIYPSADQRSILHVSNVAGTCADCHRLIEEQLNRSVHGQGNGPGLESRKTAPGGATNRRPSCTDCHVGHDMPDPHSPSSRNQQGDRCGNCHQELQTAFRLSMHGALSDLGFTAGAKCSDCHGAHEILALSHPESMMGPERRLQTCATCHEGIAPNLASFDPHANHRDQERSALVFWVYRGVLTFIITVFGIFGLHSIVWFLRGLLDVRQHGRPPALAPNDTGYTRFGRFHRVSHTVMVVSFLMLALTGLPLKFSTYQWSQWLAYVMGGFAWTGFWHRFFAVTMFGCFGAYVIFLPRCYFLARRAGATRLGAIFGPDSPIPNPRDARDIWRMMKWFVGMGPRPTFERWAYWEKFDFFGATSDTILIGTSGLILWFPDFFWIFLPGEAINVAKVVHSTLALLATGFVFAIHFFGTHFRPDKFPMDMSILTGVVSETEMHHERPELLARLEEEGRADALRAVTPGRTALCVIRIAGYVALFVGLGALAGIIWSLLV